jgi:hypothetical protein
MSMLSKLPIVSEKLFTFEVIIIIFLINMDDFNIVFIYPLKMVNVRAL